MFKLNHSLLTKLLISAASSVILLSQSACCDECGGDDYFIFPPCDSTAEFIPMETESLEMYHTPDTMVFRYKFEGEFEYVLYKLNKDTIMVDRCDTMYSYIRHEAIYTTSTTFPAQKVIILSLFKNFHSGADIFSVSVSDCLIEVPVESINPDTDHDLINYRDTINTWYLTNLGDIYLLKPRERASSGVNTVFYSKKTGIMAYHGGPKEFDGFTRVR